MNVNFFSAQIKLWARIFDYKGKSSRKEYWFAFIFHIIIGILVALNIGLSMIPEIFVPLVGSNVIINIIHYAFLIIGILFLAYLVLAIIPWIALTVRRLRDAGKSGWWTVLLLIFGIGHLVLFFLCSLASSAAGVFIPATNVPAGVYGPPDWFDPSINQNDDVYGPDWGDDYDPYYNEPATEYGPPEWDFDEEIFDPYNNNNDDVYGPEWDYDDDFDPELNVEPAVYGPPSWYKK